MYTNTLFQRVAAELPTQIDPGGLPTAEANDAHLQTIMAIVYSIIGALALLMLTISGLRYITSGGDPQKQAKARSGILLTLVGIVVALAAQAIVVFVVRRL